MDTQPTNAQLRKFISQYFTDDALESFCFDYFPEVSMGFGTGMSKNRKVIDLINYCRSNSQMGKLNAALSEERPGPWGDLLLEAESAVTVASDPDPEPIAGTDIVVHKKTAIDFVRIPAGPFQSGEGEEIRSLELPDYWIGRYPVTNAQYKRFLDANASHEVPFAEGEWAEAYSWDRQTRTYPAGKADHPVVLVSWHDAHAFCDWAGLALPTDCEWEKAARGGQDARAYPWGDEWVDGRCNSTEAAVDATTPVGRYSPQSDSPYGCADMAGNVWEWSGSWFDDDEQIFRTVRGGSCLDSRFGVRIAYREGFPPGTSGALDNVGFRVATSGEPR